MKQKTEENFKKWRKLKDQEKMCKKEIEAKEEALKVCVSVMINIKRNILFLLFSSRNNWRDSNKLKRLIIIGYISRKREHIGGERIQTQSQYHIPGLDLWIRTGGMKITLFQI